MLIQPRIPQSEPAKPLIEAMVKVLKLRHEMTISRRAFLARWHQLRRRLALTSEYQTFRDAVLAQYKAQCAECGVDARTVHHKRPVSRAPRLALDPANGQVVCEDCHEGKHPGMSLRRSA